MPMLIGKVMQEHLASWAQYYFNKWMLSGYTDQESFYTYLNLRDQAMKVKL